ncbi:MAG: hypothetical protein GY829_12820, partial [Gammaproteobacteria bacterium]|nr:hypothetical protein [Gammaproteobacteria bacterium]
MRHRERNFQIGNNTFCDYTGQAGSLYTKKSDFLTYIDAMSWHLNESSVVFEDLPDSQLYTGCSGADFIWYKFNNYYALNVVFSAATRFAQTITEEYTITVTAPQSISQYGLIEWEQSGGAEIEYDAAVWESGQT